MTTEERISQLEAQITRLEEREAELREQLVQAQIDQWHGRIEDLEVQAHLAAMDTGDRVSALIDQVRARVRDVRGQVGSAAGTVSERVEAGRSSIEGLFRDVRQGLIDAKDKATSH